MIESILDFCIASIIGAIIVGVIYFSYLISPWFLLFVLIVGSLFIANN